MKLDFNVTEILTLPAASLTALSLASGILLFSPTALLEKLFMLEFREKHGFIIGIVCVLSICILIVNLIYKTNKSISNAKAEKKFYENAEERLRKLSNYQKTIVFGLYNRDDLTFPLPLNDGAVLELEHNLIIGKATSQYFVKDINNPSFPYLLHSWVSDELSSKPALLSDFKNASDLQVQKKKKITITTSEIN